MAAFHTIYGTETEQQPILEENGGRMTCFEVAPGIRLTFNDLATTSCYRPLVFTQEYLELNYCTSGCYEGTLWDGSVSFVGEGDLCVSCLGPTHETFTGSRLPLGRYRGVTVLLECEKAQKTLDETFPQGAIDLSAIAARICAVGRARVVQSKQQLVHIFEELSTVDARIRMPYYWLKIAELLLILSTLDTSSVARTPRFSAEVSRRTQAVYEACVQEPLRVTTIGELAARFDIAPSSLKRCFKSLTGVSLGAFMKTKRLEAAAALLVAEPMLSIGEVASRAGYENQSKFSAAFKSVMGVTPHAYRCDKI